MPERTLKITCDECGYSEIVPELRLTYEEGKTCPRCYKGKMWWVPVAEEARRREFKKMPEEEKRISLAAIIIPIGLGLGLTAALGVVALAKVAPPTPPPGLANLYGKVTDAVTGGPISGVLVSLNGLEVYTGTGGNYIFEDLEPGEYGLQFSKDGYETAIY